MAQLQDLLSKNLSEMTTEELENHISMLKKLRFIEPVVKAEKKPKSNKERQVEDFFKNLTPEQMAEMMKMMKEAQGGEAS